MALRTLARDALRGASSTSASFTASSSASSSSSRLFSSSARRQLHHLPPLPARLRKGCMPLLSKSTVEMLWNEHQNGLLERLNAEVQGTELETATLVHTIIQTAGKPEDIMAFNYASLALNNAFFLSGLASPAGIDQNSKDDSYKSLPVSEPSINLETKLTASFGSVTDFKNSFSAAAYGMAGSGYVWLVWQPARKRLGIVPTFGAGTILVQKRMQRGPEGFERVASLTDEEAAVAGSGPSTENRPSLDQVAETPAATPSLSDFGRAASESLSGSESYRSAGSPLGRVLTPLLCLSVNEHAWLPDWGVCGKEEYLIRFWETVDWQRVEALCPK